MFFLIVSFKNKSDLFWSKYENSIFLKFLIVPLSGISSFNKSFKKVVLPDPFPPSIPILSPLLILKLKFSKILISSEFVLNDFETLKNSEIDFAWSLNLILEFTLIFEIARL